MAGSQRFEIPPGDPIALSVVDPEDNTRGQTVLLFNSGTVTVELGGEDVDDENSYRGFIPGAVLGVDVAEEKVFARVSGAVAGEVDVFIAR